MRQPALPMIDGSTAGLGPNQGDQLSRFLVRIMALQALFDGHFLPFA